MYTNLRLTVLAALLAAGLITSPALGQLKQQTRGASMKPKMGSNPPAAQASRSIPLQAPSYKPHAGYRPAPASQPKPVSPKFQAMPQASQRPTIVPRDVTSRPPITNHVVQAVQPKKPTGTVIKVVEGSPRLGAANSNHASVSSN